MRTGKIPIMASSSGGDPPGRASFYVPLESRLSQGDIVQGIPWGLISGPTTICRTQGGPHQAAIHKATELASAFKKGSELILAKAELSLAMVLWPDCQLDKFMLQGRPEERWFAGVAPILPMEPRLPVTVRQSVREQRRRMYFYVPPNEALGIPESFVDFRHIWSVKQSTLTPRVAAISLAARSALFQQLFVFLTYLKLKDSVDCPNCGAGFPLLAAFEADNTPADEA